MNIAGFLEDAANGYPDKLAVRFEGEKVTYKELDANCSRLANGLRDLGLKARDRCVVMMPNSITSILVYYAIAKLGAVVVPVNFLYRVHELEYILTGFQTKGLYRS